MKAILINVADKVLNRALMVHPDKLAIIASVLDGRIGIDASGLTAAALPSTRTASKGDNPYFSRRGDGVAVIPIVGSLVNRSGGFDAVSGLCSYEHIRRSLNAAANDEDVSTIALDIDSAGGEAVGAFEIADHVRAVAKLKPVITSVTGLCCSAAYAIGSASSRITVSQSSIVGSIGVVMLHLDRSRRLDQEGLVPTMIFAGKHKVDGNPLQPLSEEVREDLQIEIDHFYKLFVDTVSIGRPRLTPDHIRATEARTYIGGIADTVGLADAVGTLADVVSELSELDRKVRSKPFDKYQMAQRLHGEGHAVHLRVKDAHAAGVRAGMSSALEELKR
jgi:signal peptide peptidase SppA